MGRFVLRRLGQSVLTILGVMILTFLLFRVVSGDIAASFVGQKGTEQAKADWRNAHGYDRPLLLNVHNRLRLTDNSAGDKPFFLEDAPETKSTVVDMLALTPSGEGKNAFLGKFVWGLDVEAPIESVLALPEVKTKDKDGKKSKSAKRSKPELTEAIMVAELASGQTITVDLKDVKTCGELIDRVHRAEGNRGADGKPLLSADIAGWRTANVLDSQFIAHLRSSVTFSARSLQTNEKITDIIAQRAPNSLALTVPAMAIGWLGGMIISSFVAYYRGTIIDKMGVLLSVLGMCVPFLAYMIVGQWVMFQIAPVNAFGVGVRSNIYVPIFIMVIAGLGNSVRFYRTVILDETNRDYVRTARAKGASITSVLFKHVLKNCMLPILTNLILAIPFLIMGSLVVETYFGIPGLGGTMLAAIKFRDEPIMSAMVFLTALIYTVGLLLTDLSYAVFDPRVRLR